MIQVKRLGHATFSTPDLEKQIDYWTRVVGMTLVDRDSDRCFLATPFGEEAIALERGDEPGGLRRVAFQVKPGTDLGELVALLGQKGIKAEQRSDISPGVRKAIVLQDTQGTWVELYADYQFAPTNPKKTGVVPVKFGHVAVRVPDPQKATEFYCDILGFRVSDWIADRFSFLRCGSDHHSINFARGEKVGLVHIAFELRDRGAVMDSCQILTDNNVPLVFGPTRHVVGHNIAAYHRNPDNIRVEFMAELDTMRDEELGYWEPRPWHEEWPLRPKVWPNDAPRAQWGFGSVGTFPGYP
jgi:catechol 2,3-dioxygenase-like lactoylglutathione lyase family enzyme